MKLMSKLASGIRDPVIKFIWNLNSSFVSRQACVQRLCNHFIQKVLVKTQRGVAVWSVSESERHVWHVDGDPGGVGHLGVNVNRLSHRWASGAWSYHPAAVTSEGPVEGVRGGLGELFNGVHILLHGVEAAVGVCVFRVALLQLVDGGESVHGGEEKSALHPANTQTLMKLL